jgi:type I restriction enzyme S subunit
MKASWTKTTLGKLQAKGQANIQTGPFGTMLKASEYSDFGVPVVSVGEIRSGYLQISNRTPTVANETKIRLPQFVLEEGDIVFGRKGAIDRNAIINEKQSGWFLGSDGIRLRLSENIDSVFVSYQLRSSSVGKWLLQNSSGSIMPSLNQKTLDRLPIWLPEIKEQKKIAAILSALDAKIDLNNRINAELEAMAKTLYDYWFVQFDFPDKNGKPYKSSGGKLVWNKELKREIPEGWEVTDLGVLEKNIITGKTPPKENPEYFGGEIPFITIGDIRGNMHVVETAETLSNKGADYQKNKYLRKGAICVTCIASPGLVGFTSELSQTNQQINSIECEKEENRYYLYFAIKDYFVTSKAKTGNTFANMNKGDFASIRIIKPSEEILLNYMDKVKSSFELILNNSLENKHLSSLRDWLLPMLMNGQVKVS